MQTLLDVAGAIALVFSAYRLYQILEVLKIIVGNQADFDAKISRANAALDTIGTAIADERAQIQQFIDAHPSVDTAQLDGVVARLEGVSNNVAGIFEEPTPTAVGSTEAGTTGGTSTEGTPADPGVGSGSEATPATDSGEMPPVDDPNN